MLHYYPAPAITPSDMLSLSVFMLISPSALQWFIQIVSYDAHYHSPLPFLSPSITQVWPSKYGVHADIIVFWAFGLFINILNSEKENKYSKIIYFVKFLAHNTVAYHFKIIFNWPWCMHSTLELLDEYIIFIDNKYIAMIILDLP